MATLFRSKHEEVAAPQTFETDIAHWWQGLVNLAAGEGHGLKVGVITSGYDDKKVEILGLLPPVLRRGLMRAVPWWEPVQRGQVSWAWFDITWCPNPVGDGLRYAIPNSEVLVGLLVARRKILTGGA